MKQIFEQLQKRTSKMLITQETIENIKKISLSEFDCEETEKIQSLHKKLLKLSMKENNSNEVGLLVNLINWEYIVIYGTENRISLKNVPKARELVCTAPRNSLIFLHNHPKNSTFSETDIESFLTADSILMLTVVCNNGNLYFLAKSKNFDRYQALLYYDKIYESTEKNSVKEFLRTCKKVNLIFNYGGG